MLSARSTLLLIGEEIQTMKLSKSKVTVPKIIVAMALVILASIGFGLNLSTSNLGPNSMTTVNVLPSSVNARLNQLFTVDINITDVTNLYAYEMKIWYKNTVINGTSVIRPAGHFLEPIDPINQYIAKWEIKNGYNSTHGRIWVAFSLLSPEIPRTGSGILIRITFKGINEGTTPIVLNNYPGASGPVSLVDSSADPIPHVGIDGEATISSGVAISVSRVPSGSPSYSEEVTVTAHITCPVGIHVDNAILSHNYSSTQGSGQVNATMAPIGGDNYRAKIPKYPYLAHVEYCVYVLDSGGIWSISDPYNYSVTDNVPPVILSEVLSSKIISVNVSEPVNASGVKEVLLSFRNGSPNWWNTTMSYNNATGLWTVALGVRLIANQTIEYRITATDKAGNSAIVSIIYQAPQWWIADLNCDGVVDIFDIVIIALQFGEP